MCRINDKLTNNNNISKGLEFSQIYAYGTTNASEAIVETIIFPRK